MKNLILICAVFLVCSSHELFLKTDAYFLDPGESSELYLFNGTFNQSENVITRDRIVKPMIIGPAYAFAPEEKDYFDRGNATFLKWTAGETGTYTAGISTLPRIIELTATEFNDYLVHEGLNDVLDERKSKGIDNRDAREKYSKHVKALLQVGDSRTDHYSAILGYPIEFVPLSNPYTIKTGEEIQLELRYLGQPLVNQVVHYGYQDSNTGKVKKTSLRTDERGHVNARLGVTGQWFFSTIYMKEKTGEKLDYESNWATITFAVR